MKVKGVIIRYLMILCCFKMLVLSVIILLQNKQELVGNTPTRRVQYVILVLSRHRNICRPLCPTNLRCVYKIPVMCEQSAAYFDTGALFAGSVRGCTVLMTPGKGAEGAVASSTC